MSSEKNSIPSPFNLYIGFGGAGGKVLSALAECIHQDFEASKQADMDYAFVLVDTDQADLRASSEKIERNLSGLVSRANLLVDTIAMGGPFKTKFSKEVFTAYDRYRRNLRAGQENLLQRAWWMVPGAAGAESTPLTLPGVEDPKEGASQMPLASHLMTFWNEARIKDVVGRIVDGFKVRFAEQAGNKRINMYFVTSLAGGTGRGSWAALSFLFRHAFEDRGIQASPLGLFLDAGVFEPRFSKSDPDVMTQLRLNALTGFSELAMFLRNATEFNPGKELLGRTGKLAYELPSLKGGTMFTAQAAGHTREGGPVDGALLIFRESETVPYLTTEDRYYELAGQALFMCLRDSDFRSKSWNNRGANALFAVGASMAAVPTAELIQYVESYKRWYFLERELNESGDLKDKQEASFKEVRDQAKPEGLLKILTQEAEQATGYTTVLGTYLKDKSKDVADIIAYAEKQKSSFKFDTSIPRWVRTLGFKLEPDEASSRDESNSDASVRELPFSAKDDAGRVAETIVRAVMWEFTRSSSGAMPLKACRKALKDIRKSWQDWRPPSGTAGGKSRADLVADLKKASKRGGFLGLTGERFSEKEILGLVTTASLINSREAAQAAATQLAQLSPTVIERLDEAEKFADELLAVLASRAKEIKKNVKASCFVVIDTDGKQLDEAPELLVPDARFGADVRVQYELKPIRNSDHEKRLNAAIEAQWEKKEDSESRLFAPMIQASKAAVFSAMAAEAGAPGIYAGREKTKQALVDGFVQAIDVLRCDPGFVEANFSLAKVLEEYLELIPKIHERLKGAAQKGFAENLRRVFGITNPASPGNVEDCVAGLAAYVAANCHPFARLVPNSDSQFSVRVFVPAVGNWENSDNASGEVEKRIARSPVTKERKLSFGQGTEGRTAKVWVSAGNRFAIGAFSAAGTKEWLDPDSKNLGFLSLEYWQENDNKNVLAKLLWAAEERGPANLAYGHEHAFNGGIGFIDPRFVEDDAWANLRWRPWPRPDPVSAEGEQADVDALCLAYLCLGNFVPEANRKKYDASASETIAKLHERNWELPILAKDAEGSGWSWKRKAYRQDLSEVTEGECGWKKSKLKSLRDMIAAFRAIPPEGKALLHQEIEALRVLLKFGGELDLQASQREALCRSVDSFLNYVIEEVLPGYKDRDSAAAMAEIGAILASAAKASSRLLPPPSVGP
jgi:hypothetical protein